ncbi:hypothetical protein EB118_06360 [bacterium]|nr:hypothetical protein [bacterium]NDC94379.1 hypothetical protein [bacterium]NDG29701.1 hypothetical protein [bacterium]
MSEPSVITLDPTNSTKIMAQYIELAQTKGAFDLNEAELLKRASDVLLSGAKDNELNLVNSKQILVQGIYKGQKQGAFTLNDAALLSKVVKYVLSTLNEPVPPAPLVDAPVPSPDAPQAIVRPQQDIEESESDDLSSLADPIPLKPKEI